METTHPSALIPSLSLSYRNASPCDQHTEVKQRQTRQSVKQRKIYYRSLQGDGWLMPLKPQNPRTFSEKPFYGKDEGGLWLVVADFLVSDPSLLKSGHR